MKITIIKKDYYNRQIIYRAELKNRVILRIYDKYVYAIHRHTIIYYRKTLETQTYWCKKWE